MGDAAPVYAYLYWDDKTPYYYDPVSQQCSYEVPASTIIINPSSMRVMRRVRAEAVLKIVQRPRTLSKFDRIGVRQAAARPAAPSLASELQDGIAKFRLENYAQQFFRERRGQHAFLRKTVDANVQTDFSAAPIEGSLLSALDPKMQKLASKCFRLILGYTGVAPAKSPAECAEQLVGTLYSTPALRDEVMFQLAKQTRNNPNERWLVETWKLFLIVVTYFPSTHDSEVWIRSHFTSEIHNENQAIADLAQFCFIRFTARCAVGKPLADPPDGYLLQVPSHHQTSRALFGASIYEQLWNQRRSVRKLPIPYILPHMADNLLRKCAEQCEGIFRLPGNMKTVAMMAEAANQGREMIAQAPIHDIGSLFKMWFRDLPDPVVNIDSVDELRNVWETKEYVKFAESLPPAHKLTLMYLVGFLQRLARAEAVTLMSQKNLAIVFAPNIVQVQTTNPATMKLFSDIGQEFLITLIATWDTSYIYPLNPEMLSEM
jgi:hypothetical protein